MLVLQNGFIKGFVNSNDTKKHVEVVAVRPVKNNAQRYQLFANANTTLREGFQHFANKITRGLTSCKVYDQFHIKRCYNCREFGHYAEVCPSSDSMICGKRAPLPSFN